MTHEEKTQMRKAIYEHMNILLNKVHEMFKENEKLSPQQMSVGADILKDIASTDKSLSKACYYDAQRGADSDKKY
jgi:hypothetical protein